jgi:hypothetical protein
MVSAIETELKDGTEVTKYSDVYPHLKELQSSLLITQSIVLEECSVYADIINQSPLVKFFTFLMALIVALIVVCGSIICCSYFQLEKKYQTLEDSVRQ